MAKRYNNVFNNEISANLNKLYDGPFQRDIRENTAAHFNLMDNCDRVLNNIRYVRGGDKLMIIVCHGGGAQCVIL